jgi:CMP-N-acetylneuraminic acid synthetase
MKTLAVILARAGSEGLKSKHLREIGGMPVIEYTFDHARDSKLLDLTVVSTDCPRIKELARARDLAVIDRPAQLASSSASVQDAMLHAMDAVESRGDFHADALVVLYGNVPIRPPGIIDAAVDLLEKTACDSVRSFCPVGKWHPAWMSRLDGDRVESLIPGSIHRRQDLTPLYLHDGAVVAVSRLAMLRARENPADPHAFFGTDRRGVLADIGQTVEVDHARDLLLAEAILKDRAIPTARVA